VVNTTPAFGAAMSPGADFDGHFTLKNTGAYTWGAPDYDVVYVYGPKEMVKTQRIDLPKDVASGQTVDIQVDLLAPSTPGFYSVEFVLEGAAKVCSMDVSINVK
jgi:hypothetical protein